MDDSSYKDPSGLVPARLTLDNAHLRKPDFDIAESVESEDIDRNSRKSITVHAWTSEFTQNYYSKQTVLAGIILFINRIEIRFPNS